MGKVWFVGAGPGAADLITVRLQTGDPTLYGTLAEMARPLDRAGIEIGIVPGASSSMASAAAAGETLTLPEVTQTLILTRMEGRTTMPERESLASLAAHGCSLCIFLSIDRIGAVVEALRSVGWAESAPITVVEKATWPGQDWVLRGTLADIAERCEEAGIRRQAMILARPALGARRREDALVSRPYDEDFSHGFRRARD